MEINLKNIEEQIFFDKKIQTFFPEFRHYFDQWHLSKVYPGFVNLGKRSVVDLLNSIETKHILILEEYFGCPILVNKIDPNIVKNYEAVLENVELCQFTNYHEFCLYRNKDEIKITFWR